jgi:type II secretory pathway pseudopilin PulG|tara:strand:+ start:739 stop:1023 length:285 start_codon:yes stop_codon:yes gene_type:complete
METIIIVLSVVLAISLFVNINQLRKQESQSDYIEELENSNTEYYTFFQRLKTQIGESNSKLKQIDRLGSFESDDETGFAFKELKDIYEDLNKGF